MVSKSGFSKNALTAVLAEGGWVEAVRPEVVEVGGEPVIKRLYIDEFTLSPTICRLHVQPASGDALVVRALPDTLVFDADGNELGSALRLSTEALNLDWLKRRFGVEAHQHPERDELKGFSFGMQIGALGYHLRWEETGELQPIQLLELHGTFVLRRTSSS